MGINSRSLVVEARIYPIVIRDNGSMQVTLRRGIIEDGVFKAFEQSVIELDAAEVTAMLGVAVVKKQRPLLENFEDAIYAGVTAKLTPAGA